MLHRLLLSSLALPALASLKDLSQCDPLKKDARKSIIMLLLLQKQKKTNMFITDCPPDPAFASKATFDFTKASWDDDTFTSFWAVDASTAQDKRQLILNNDNDNSTDGKGKGAAFSIWQDGQAPTLTSTRYFLFGKLSVEVQAAPGPGLITAIVLKSDSGDEIDWVGDSHPYTEDYIKKVIDCSEIIFRNSSAPSTTKRRQTTFTTASPYSTRTTQPTTSTPRPLPPSKLTASNGRPRSSASPSTTPSARRGASATSPRTSGPRRPCRSSSASGPSATAATRAPSSGPAGCLIGMAAMPRRTPTGRTSRRLRWRTIRAAATRR